MSLDSFRISEVLPASPELVYATWLSSLGHAEMTGAGARVVPGVGGKFSAWDGYIWGITLELEPNARIVQSWRTLEFPGDAKDSRLEVRLEQAPEGCRVTLIHGSIPAGQGESYRQGWYDHYFDPMRAYFARLAKAGRTSRKPRKRKAASKSRKRRLGKRRPGKRAAPSAKRKQRSGKRKGKSANKGRKRPLG